MTPLLELLIGQAPALIGFVGELLKQKDPTAPPPTSAEIVAAFEQVFKDSLSRDAFLKAALQAEIDAHAKPA